MVYTLNFMEVKFYKMNDSIKKFHLLSIFVLFSNFRVVFLYCRAYIESLLVGPASSAFGYLIYVCCLSFLGSAYPLQNTTTPFHSSGRIPICQHRQCFLESLASHFQHKISFERTHNKKMLSYIMSLSPEEEFPVLHSLSKRRAFQIHMQSLGYLC